MTHTTATENRFWTEEKISWLDQLWWHDRAAYDRAVQELAALKERAAADRRRRGLR